MAMSTSDAGRKGGNAVKQKYGPQFYEKIGKMGGERIKQLVQEALEMEDNSED